MVHLLRRAARARALTAPLRKNRVSGEYDAFRIVAHTAGGMAWRKQRLHLRLSDSDGVSILQRM
ncbi:hypothetical protein D3C85_1862240 [compost metagenome]